MGYDFAGDSNCIARYRFQNGALTADSKGTNTLDAFPTFGPLPTANTSDYREWSASLALERDNAQYLAAPDTGLESTFPGKYGTSNKIFSLTAWIKLETLYSSNTIIQKGGAFQGSYWLRVDNATLQLAISDGGMNWEVYSYGTVLQTGRWYHIGATYNDTTKAYRIRVWDDTAGALLGADLTGTGTYNMGTPNIDFQIGSAAGFPSHCLDGLIDEVCVFNDVLTPDEIDAICAGWDPPSKAVSPSPADDATDVDIGVTCSWSDGGGATSYDVYWGTTSGALTLVSDGQAGTTYDPPGNLDYGETYYWRIDSEGDGGIVTGDVWSFTTASAATVADVPPFFLAFPAVLPIKERLSFHTSILTSADGSQQRIAHRAGIPIQYFTQRLLARTEALSVKLMNLLHSSLKGQQYIPVWAEAERIGIPLAAGATSLVFDARYADYRASGTAAVYAAPDLAEVVTVSVVNGVTGLTLAAPGLANDYPSGAWIMPCRTGYIVSAAQRQRFAGGASLVEVTYAVTDNIAITGWTAALTYDGYDVLTDPAIFTGDSFREQHDADFTLVDAGLGAFKIVSVSDFNVGLQDHGWKNDTKAKAWSFRQFLHAVVGRQKAFLVPTFRPDFVLSRDCGATDTRIYVENRGYYQHLGGLNSLRTYLAFRPVGATIIPRKITGIAAQSATEEALDLAAAPGTAFAAGSELCWVDRCTLASDDIEIQWYRRGRNLCETQLMRVSQ